MHLLQVARLDMRTADEARGLGHAAPPTLVNDANRCSTSPTTGLVIDRTRRRDHHVGRPVVAREVAGDPPRSNERTVAGVPRIERPTG